MRPGSLEGVFVDSWLFVQVHVFDLAENKHEPMCDQKVVRKSKLTHISFNPKEPILLVGDDKVRLMPSSVHR